MLNLKPKTILAGAAGGYLGGFAAGMKTFAAIPEPDHVLPAAGGAALGWLVGGRKTEDALIGGVAGWLFFQGAKKFNLPLYPNVGSLTARNWVPAGGVGGVYRPIS